MDHTDLERPPSADRYLVVVNESARACRQGDLERALGAAGLLERCEVVATGSIEEVGPAVERAAAEGFVVVAAGGDGTVHAVINSLATLQEPPPLGLLPTGTANNFCRALGVPLLLEDAAQALHDSRRTPVDLIHAATSDEQRWCATIATTGNTERVMQRLDDRQKKLWGAWCFLQAALPVVADLQSIAVRMSVDGRPFESASLWNLIVANTPIAGGGLLVAPKAQIDDGRLDVIAVREGEGIDLASLASHFLTGDYTEHERVSSVKARSATVESDSPLEFLVDGEKLEGSRFVFRVAPAAIRVVGVGERERA
ncbi:diacylglycerol kinase family protein [Botrimarina sp.]|uniref:diacylglycerol/lipid kinase family protein n=1 Tax=Botrimarina sp. TaxID=2795802 RepID=UPI0032EED8C3